MQSSTLPSRNRLIQLGIVLLCVLQFAILLFMVVAAFLNSVAYVRDYVDDTAYHIPIAIEIARHRNPYYVDTNSTFTSFWFPGGAETIVAFIVSITHTINSTNLSGSMFFVLLLIVAYKFAGLWTHDFHVRLLCVVATSLIPILFAQTRAFYIDIHFNFFVYLALYLYCLSLVSEDVNYSYLGMGAAIFSAGIKYHGVLICAVLVPVGVYFALKFKNKPLYWWSIVFLVLCTVFSSGWYIRNWILKGNPVYPLALAQPFQTVLSAIGTPYQCVDYPNLSPQAQWPHPLIPRTVSHYRFQPDMTDDAFGIVFPLSLAILVVVGLRLKKMPRLQLRASMCLLAMTAAIVVVMPFGFSVPRYVLFVPVVAALWPAMIMACTSNKNLVYLSMSIVVVMLGATYIQANFINSDADKSILQNAVSLLQENRRSDIVRFDFVEKGDLRIGYLGGGFAFVASLYDQKLTNDLVQLHYQDYLLDKGREFKDPNEFVEYIQSLELDYIVVFDEQAPGADIILDCFAEKTFVENSFK
jgi:hypothetical protein